MKTDSEIIENIGDINAFLDNHLSLVHRVSGLEKLIQTPEESLGEVKIRTCFTSLSVPPPAVRKLAIEELAVANKELEASTAIFDAIFDAIKEAAERKP